MVDPSVCLQLGNDVANGVDRDGEADARVSPESVSSPGESRSDANHLALRVQERAAGVAFVQARVCLDHAVDRASVGGPERALEGADDAGADAPAIAERVADRSDLVANLDHVRVAELERLQGSRARLDLEEGDVRGWVPADHLRLHRVAIREAHVDRLGARDDVVVRDDVASLVDHEARPEIALHLRPGHEGVPEPLAPGQIDRRGRRHLDDSRRVPLIDLGDAHCSPADRPGARGWGIDELRRDDPHRRCLPTDSHDRSDRNGHAAAGNRRNKQGNGHGQGFFAHGDLHRLCIARGSLRGLCASVKRAGHLFKRQRPWPGGGASRGFGR